MAKDKDKAINEFTEIPGVGRSKARVLFDAGYESIEDLKKATVEDLEACKGINKSLANDIHAYFKSEDQDAEDEECLPPPPGDDEESKSESDILMYEGIELHKNGKWGQALQSFNEALRLDPVNTKALMARGEVYLGREKYEKALDAFEVLIEINPENDKAWVRLGDTLVASERVSEAMACYKKALEINPENEKARQCLSENERIKTYIEGLDEKLEGGIPVRHIVLVCGRAGSMKSSISYSILHNLARHERVKGIYLTLEQSRASLLRHMKKLGFDPEGVSSLVVNDLEDMVIIDMSLLRKETTVEDIGKIDWLNSIVTQVKSYKKTYGCEVVVIDSMSALYSLTTFSNPRSELFVFFEKLRDLGITVFLISEMFDPEKDIFGTYGVEEFLADSIIHLKTEKSGKGTNLFLGVVKMRETNHDRDYYPLIVDKHGFEIVHD